MIKIGILGDIGSGKSYVARNFGYPVFDADYEVSIIYKENRTVFKKLKKVFQKYINSFPIKKAELTKLILVDRNSLKKIIKIVHPVVRSKMKSFLKQNNKQKAVVLDIPLYLENKINLPNDVLIYVDAKKSKIQTHLKKRKNYDSRLISILQSIQLSTDIKKMRSDLIIKNDFNKKNAKKKVKEIIREIII